MRLMEIDLYELPIPNWGLTCPTCQYQLRGLPSHRCPECGTRLEMEKVVRTWSRLRDPRFKGWERPFPDFGLLCVRCSRPVAGATESACPHCRKRFEAAALRPTREWFGVEPWVDESLPLAVLESALAEEYVPFLLREDKSFHTIYGLSPEVRGRLLVSSEFFFDFLHLVRRVRERFKLDREAAGTTRWVCRSCGERNPGHFQVCWMCGRQHIGEGDPGGRDA